MLSDEYLLYLSRTLAAAVRSGLPLGDAFETLSRSPSCGKAITSAAKLTARGISLHEALEAQKIFPPIFIILVRAGEESGKIDEFLDRFADCLEFRIDFRRRIKRALVYPAFTVILAGALFLFFSVKAVPLLFDPLLSAGITAPAWILWLDRLGGRLCERWPMVLAFLFIAGLAFRSFWRSGLGRRTWALAGHWLPGFKFAAEQARLYHISTTMGLLIKAGIPVGTMMDVLLQFFKDDPVTHRHVSRASTLLSKGKSFSESVAACLPPEDGRSLQIAEKAGRLDETLLRLGKTYHDRHLHRLKLLTTGCQISATLALAPLCFGLIMSLLCPVLSLLKGYAQDFFGSPAAFSQAQPRSRFDAAEDAQSALFNESKAKGILDFMQKKQPKKSSTLKLKPMPPIRTIQFQKIQPTSIHPTNFGESGNNQR